MVDITKKLLSPKILDKSDPSYTSVIELQTAVSQEACKNIAVTGIYGAGKSSVINTFVSEYETNNPGKRLLRISLSTFDSASDTNKDYDKKAYETDVEYKLVQQILYRSNQEELYQSSFKRIKYRPIEKMRCLSWRILLSLLALAFLYEPAVLRIDSLDLFFKELIGDVAAKWVGLSLDFLSLGWLAYIAYLLLYWGIKGVSSMAAFKLKAKDVEVEVSKDSSVFSKMLEELYYFFRAGKYDVVVIEDLDRLKDPASLFLKIRELNVLLNESFAFRSEGKIVRFIYAVKDDLFDSELRVKFFDYIVPVVPIINTYNAADYIIENRADIFEGEDDLKHNIPEIAFFIKDMRALKNVLNEFEVYKQTIIDRQANLSDSKMFAMIVYKNNWPDNYSRLHTRSSILNLLFDDPSKFIGKLFEKEIARQSTLEKEINTKETEAKNIRSNCANALRSQGITKLISKDGTYSLNDLIEYDYIFARVQQDKFDQLTTIDRNTRQEVVHNRSFSFADLMSRGGVTSPALQSLIKLREELQTISEEKTSIDSTLAHKRASSFKEILMNVDGDWALACIKESKKGLKDDLYDFILSMLRKGYIAEDYHSYISFNYEGIISNKDRAFINAVFQGRSLSYDYQLDNPQSVRKQLEKEDNYSTNSILNFAFIQYLVQSKDEKLSRVSSVARKSWSFIRSCDNVGGTMNTFLKAHVFKGWYNCIESLLVEEKKELADNLKVFLHYCPKEVILDESQKESLSGLYDVISAGVSNVPLAAGWLKSKNVAFHSLVSPATDPERAFFEAVVDGGLFAITQDNMSVILGEPFYAASYSTIVKCEKEKLIDYLDGHIAETVLTFPDTSINEEEMPMKKLLNNSYVDKEWKKSYFEKQSLVMKTFDGLEDENVEYVLSTDKIDPAWNNVSHALEKSDIQVLKTFVSLHTQELGTQFCALSDGHKVVLEQTLFANNDFLTIDAYSVLVKQFDIPLDVSDLDGLEEERMALLVEHGLVSFSEAGLEMLSSYQSSTIAHYVVDHFEDYKEYAENFIEFCNNEFGEYLLESILSDVHKDYYLSHIAPSELVKDDHYRSYSKLICEYLNQRVISSETNLDLAAEAIRGYSERGDWFVKIALINKINAFAGYEIERVTKMINALGGGYVELNSYYGAIALDDNPQNRELLQFLVENGHYVNKFYPRDDGKLKVTFKHGPGR